MAIIQSMLDNDLYSFTQQKAILAYRQDVPVKYKFYNRRPEGQFNTAFENAFKDELRSMQDLKLTNDEGRWLESSIPFLGKPYIEYLRNYRYNPNAVKFEIVNNELEMIIDEPWERALLWEVPLLATISELYFQHCDTNWKPDYQLQLSQLEAKAKQLEDCSFADFGTRRRRNFHTQNMVVETMSNISRSFSGTSNVHLAHKYNVKAIGTMSHQWIMGISALESLRHANRYALKIWSKVFDGRLGIALTDTFGTEAFFEDFDGYLARLFDGVRHDSGDPIEFGEKVIAHYTKLGIYPMSKSIVFSDGLNPTEAVKIAVHFKDRIRTSFGIGTNFTNDFPGSKPLNMVIKIDMVNGIPVVKLSDVPSKSVGEKDAQRVARWIFFKELLDARTAIAS